ncbi:Domain of uncharacterised function DUF20 [Chlamydia trachomatis]|nr:Domain of uncharacterised function DUF20 [Chlamydia trachomatis]
MIFMTLLTAPFVLFYMLKDGHQLNGYLTKFAPRRWQDSFSRLLHDSCFDNCFDYFLGDAN